MKREQNQFSKKKGISIIELVMTVGIIGIMSGFLFYRYEKIRYKNIIDSDKLKITTTINNTNIISAKLPGDLVPFPRYMKFANDGIIILGKGNDNKLELKPDQGLNVRKMREKNVAVLFNCGVQGTDKKLECPKIVFNDGENGDNPSEIDLPETEETARGAGYVEFSGGAPDKSFTVYIFDEKKIAKNRIKYKGKDELEKVMLVEIYKYVGPRNLGDSETWSSDNVEEKNPSKEIGEVVGIWKLESYDKPLPGIEIR